jgi:hypothetical protein
MQAKAQSLWPSPPLIIGQAYQGGYYAGQISTAGNGIADYNLVVGPVASTQSSLFWKTSRTTTAGTTSVINGPTNSSNMNNASHPAAQFCEGLTIGGYTDWYMPAKNEMEVCYYNLKPTTTANNTGYGANANSVPYRGATNYTTGTPAQTSAADFQTSGAEDFSTSGYWTSTENSATTAFFCYFSNGYQGFGYKDFALFVRAVRRIPV